LAGRLADRLEARFVASAGMSLTVVGLGGLAFLGPTSGYWYVILMLCVMGVGFALFVSPVTHTIMGSIEKRHVGVAGAILATMRVTGQNMSMGIATLLLAIFVGRHAIGPADFPHLMTSVRLGFAIFALFCVVGVLAALVGPSPRRVKQAAEAAVPMSQSSSKPHDVP
jgi:MFS family permease